MDEKTSAQFSSLTQPLCIDDYTHSTKTTMYNCQKCQQSIKPHTPKHRLVVEKRKKIYHWSAEWMKKARDKKIPIPPPPEGWEIVREIDICPICAKNSNEDF